MFWKPILVQLVEQKSGCMFKSRHITTISALHVDVTCIKISEMSHSWSWIIRDVSNNQQSTLISIIVKQYKGQLGLFLGWSNRDNHTKPHSLRGCHILYLHLALSHARNDPGPHQELQWAGILLFILFFFCPHKNALSITTRYTPIPKSWYNFHLMDITTLLFCINSKKKKH